MNTREFTISLFSKSPGAPGSIDLVLEDLKTADQLFDRIKSIFMVGLCILFGESENEIDISKLQESDIGIMKKYMLSIGYSLDCHVISSLEKDSLFKNLLYDIDHITCVDITVCSNWRTQLIEDIILSIPMSQDEEITKLFELILLKHRVLNYIIKVVPPLKLVDFNISVHKGSDTLIVISFDHYIHDDSCRNAGVVLTDTHMN